MSKVSILLCAYNAEAYIAEAVGSTLAQTYHDFELIIVDDGSTDGTLDIIRSFDDERIRVIEGHRRAERIQEMKRRGIIGRMAAAM